MSGVVILTLGLILVLSFALLAVVAIATGHLNTRGNQKLERSADTLTRHLNGQGTPPAFFERLNQPKSD